MSVTLETKFTLLHEIYLLQCTSVSEGLIRAQKDENDLENFGLL